MPIYEFVCNKCGNEFEELVFSTELPACPRCGTADTQKMLSACARRKRANSGASAEYTPSGGGCAGCSGGNCSACGH